MRFPETIKASSGYMICMSQNIHKGMVQPKSMAAFRSAHDEGYMLCAFKKAFGHHEKL